MKLSYFMDENERRSLLVARVTDHQAISRSQSGVIDNDRLRIDGSNYESYVTSKFAPLPSEWLPPS